MEEKYMTSWLHIEFPSQGKELTVIVEAAHIYTNETPGEDHQLSAQVGSTMSNLLGLLGYPMQRWLFIDNYNPHFQEKPIVLDEGEYCKQLQAWGFFPDHVVYEQDLVPAAKDVLAHLVAQGHAYKHPLTGNFLLQKGNINLYEPKRDHVKCALLDACLYLEKVKQSGCSITILEEQYVPQQKATMTILKKLGIDTSLLVPVYYKMPTAEVHPSVQPSQVYSAGQQNGNAHFPLPDLIGALKLLGRVSQSLPITTSLDMEVMRSLV